MWSSEGCTLNETESSEENVTCDCDHNTAFAIMMDVAGVQVRSMLYSGVVYRLSGAAQTKDHIAIFGLRRGYTGCIKKVFEM